MPETPRHRLFVSYHHEDQAYKDKFIQMMGDDIVDESVGDGDIDDRDKTSTIRQKIRDEFIRDASVTVVLIGPRTWQRKYVDWEIGSSLRKTKRNSRCGLLGIVLPNHPYYEKTQYRPDRMPPRLIDNVKGKDPYAIIYHWPRRNRAASIRKWVHRAFARRNGTPPNNSRDHFGRNRSTKQNQVRRNPPGESLPTQRQLDRTFRSR